MLLLVLNAGCWSVSCRVVKQLPVKALIVPLARPDDWRGLAVQYHFQRVSPAVDRRALAQTIDVLQALIKLFPARAGLFNRGAEGWELL